MGIAGTKAANNMISLVMRPMKIHNNFYLCYRYSEQLSFSGFSAFMRTKRLLSATYVALIHLMRQPMFSKPLPLFLHPHLAHIRKRHQLPHSHHPLLPLSIQNNSLDIRIIIQQHLSAPSARINHSYHPSRVISHNSDHSRDIRS
jgi:hypothetical protein